MKESVLGKAVLHSIISPLLLKESLKDRINLSWVTSQETNLTCCVPQSLKSGTSAQHMSAWICTAILRVHPWGDLGCGTHYIQVRDSQAFKSVPGPVKATQLCTVLTHTKAPGPLNGLPAGLFTVMAFSHTAMRIKILFLWQIAWVISELLNLYCILCFILGFSVYVPATWSAFWECGLLVTGREGLFGENKIILHKVGGHVCWSKQHLYHFVDSLNLICS